MGDFADLVEGYEEPAIKDFGPIGAIKAFDESVLLWFAGLEVPQFDAFGRTPIGKVLRGQLRPIIQAKRFRQAAPGGPLLQPPNHPRSRQAGIDRDGQRCADAFI
jgi:hypothetical protein